MPGFFEKSYKQFIPLCITHIYAYLGDLSTLSTLLYTFLSA